MTANESKDLKTGARVYWQGNIHDAGTITEKNWNAVTADKPKMTRMTHTGHQHATDCAAKSVSAPIKVVD